MIARLAAEILCFFPLFFLSSHQPEAVNWDSFFSHPELFPSSFSTVNSRRGEKVKNLISERSSKWHRNLDVHRQRVFGIQYSFPIIGIPFFTTQVSLTQFQINFTDKLFFVTHFSCAFSSEFRLLFILRFGCRVGTGSVEICDKTFFARKPRREKVKVKRSPFSLRQPEPKMFCVLAFFLVSIYSR